MTTEETEVVNGDTGRLMGRLPPALWAVKWRQRSSTSPRAKTNILVFTQRAQAQRVYDRLAGWHEKGACESPEMTTGDIAWQT